MPTAPAAPLDLAGPRLQSHRSDRTAEERATCESVVSRGLEVMRE